MSLLIPDLKKSDISRFWSKVAKIPDPNKCWEWMGSKRRRGYGRFSIRVSKGIESTFVASRIAYFLKHRVDPKEMVVCHECDNTGCVNPFHLFLGTNKDNTDDMMAKGRGIQPVGSRHGRSKLKEEDVYKIRDMVASGQKQAHVAKLYNVDQSAINNIIKGKNWQWLS